MEGTEALGHAPVDEGLRELFPAGAPLGGVPGHGEGGEGFMSPAEGRGTLFRLGRSVLLAE